MVIMRTIGVVTTSRSDYGLYLPILKEIHKHPRLKLLLYVTGMHLSQKYGHTVDLIRKDGFAIAAKVGMLFADSPSDIARAMGKGTAGFAKIFKTKRPDILLVLGDRFEMHAAAVAAVPFGIPIAHIHGGELTFGSFDDYFRHSMTKLSHLHFATTKEYAKRIKQMGEEPWRVAVAGAPGLDNISNLKRLSKEELTKKYRVDFSKPVLLVTFHPVTMDAAHTQKHITGLLTALKTFKGFNIVFTLPNADTQNHIIARNIKLFLRANPSARLVGNFGTRGYLSMMRCAKAMVGNSSSGIIEAASFKLPVVNIGTRQEGRIKPKNVIDCGYAATEIKAALRKALSGNFRCGLTNLKNPYGNGKAAGRIVSFLARVDLAKLQPKRFHNFK